MNAGRTETIRYHDELYRTHALFEPDSWLSKPARFVMHSLDFLHRGRPNQVLDLGSGVGRHTIPIARHLPEGSTITGIDLLPIAIEQLQTNASEAGVDEKVTGVVADLENITLPAEQYDLVVACSTVEHVSNKAALEQAIERIQASTARNGLNCFVINADRHEITENDTYRAALVEFPLSRKTVQSVLERLYEKWNVIEFTQRAAAVNECRDDEKYSLEFTRMQFLARKNATPD